VGPRHIFWAGEKAGIAAGETPSHAAKVSTVIDIIGEVNRVSVRCTALFTQVREASGLSGIEALTLCAIANATVAPTVPQVGRILGHPRQVIQRAVRVLVDAGFVQPTANPGHKRAALLTATEKGSALAQEIYDSARDIASVLAENLDIKSLSGVHQGLERLRDRIDEYQGGGEE
jgi:DNA-binding MarR family transcriptional regulator